MGFWLELLAEAFGMTAAEIAANKTPRRIMLLIFVLIVLILIGAVLYSYLV